MIRIVVVSILWLIAASTVAQTRAPPGPQADLSAVPTEVLIDQLATLDEETAGVAASGVYETFMAEDGEPQFTMGLIPAQRVTIPPQMRELVRRGGTALPALVSHIRDQRPTRIVVGDGFLVMRAFSSEYDPRSNLAFRSSGCLSKCPEFDSYTVAIGDICEVLIGQIVNRRMTAVRYQPTAILFVNSPIMTPELAQRIEADWKGVDSKGLEASLLNDIVTSIDAADQFPPETDKRIIASANAARTQYRHQGALKRLRFYYPQTYATLDGKLLTEREIFEKAEHDEGQTQP